ncbi:MAG: type II secretion system F family protein, partial [Puniceicoccales bacterium]|nr:type II secretion system F family protein [Puniceicoccales bacterium]
MRSDYFFEKLHKMLAAGITLSDAISVINKRTVDPTEKNTNRQIFAGYFRRQSFSDDRKSLHMKIKSNMYRIILGGESRGNLVTVLKDIIDLLRSKNELKQTMISSLIYPSF